MQADTQSQVEHLAVSMLYIIAIEIQLVFVFGVSMPCDWSQAVQSCAATGLDYAWQKTLS